MSNSLIHSHIHIPLNDGLVCAKHRYNGAIFSIHGEKYIVYRTQDDIQGVSRLAISHLGPRYQAQWSSFLDTGNPHIPGTAEDPSVTVLNKGGRFYVHVFYNTGFLLAPEERDGDLSIRVAIYEYKSPTQFELLSDHAVTYLDRQKVEKNWVFFYNQQSWWCIYSFSPWKILKFDENWVGRIAFQDGTAYSYETKKTRTKIKTPKKTKTVTWTRRNEERVPFNPIPDDWHAQFGQLRGGSSPVICLPPTGVFGVGLLEPEYHVVFHSRFVPLKKFGLPPTYVGGLLSFEAEFPFRPLGISRNPLVIPDYNDYSAVESRVYYPRGLLIEDGRLVISSGYNDNELKIDIFDAEEVTHVRHFRKITQAPLSKDIEEPETLMVQNA